MGSSLFFFFACDFLIEFFHFNCQVILERDFLSLVCWVFVWWLRIATAASFLCKFKERWLSIHESTDTSEKKEGKIVQKMKSEEDNLLDIQDSPKKLLNLEFEINCDVMITDKLTLIRQLLLQIRHENINGTMWAVNLIDLF